MTLSDYFRHYVIKNRFIAGIFALISLYILYHLRYLFMNIFIAYIIATASLPWVNYLQSKKIRRGIASLIPVLLSVLIVALVIIPLTSIIVNQWIPIVTSITAFLAFISKNIPAAQSPSELVNTNLDKIPQIGTTVFGVTGSLFEGAFTIFLILYLSYYFILDNEKIRKVILRIFPVKQRTKISKAEEIIQEKMGSWLRGQILSSLTIGFMAWLAYIIIGIPYAITLGSLAAILEILPNIGPAIAIAPALILAYSISPTKFLYTFIAYILIHAIEAYILVPNIMRRSVGLHPIAIVLGIVIGSSLFGITGALLAIPFISLCTIVFDTKTWEEVKPTKRR